MENQENLNLKLRQPLSMLGAIRETMNTIARNRRVLIVSLWLVILINIRWDLEPLQEDFGFQISFRGERRDVTRDVHKLQPMKYTILFCFFCLYMYFKIITISSSYDSYNGNTLSILGAFLKASRNWKRPLLTFGCIFLLTLGVNLVYSFLFVVIPILARRPHVTSSSLFSISSLVLKWICNVHMAALWTMTIVVSVLEDNISGFKAIHDRAGDLLKKNRIQAYIVMMLYHIACLVAGKTFEGLSMQILEERVMWVIKIIFVRLFPNLFKVFVFVFYTVLYHECKMDHQEDGVLRASSVVKKSL